MADVRKVARLLGGSRVLERRIRTAMDLHEVLERGLPLQSLQFFAENRRHLAADSVVAFVLGPQQKTHRWLPVRLRGHQTDRLFVLADALASASEAFKSMRRAEEWLISPSASPEMGGRRPADLLTTPIGERIVSTLIAAAELMLRIERAAEQGMNDIAEGRYTVVHSPEESRQSIERISRRVARRHRARAGRNLKKS